MLLRHVTLYVALFLSGASALVYQTAWARMLHRVFGVGDLAVATVLATFFLGLGLGAGLGGRWARGLRRPALAYAALECAIGLYALLSLALIPNVHGFYASVGAGAGFASLTALRLLIALLILLPPTLMMGATLPVLVAVVARGRGDWSAPATALYATNTFGAMLGAGLTGLYLLGALGTRLTVVAAAAGNVAASIAVLVAWWRATDGGSAPPAVSSAVAPPSRAEHAALAMGLAFLAGVAALSSEVLWTRVLRMIVQGTTTAFAAMLVTFLFGIAVGSLLADRLARGGRRPLLVFGAFQLLLAILTVGAMAVTPQLPRLLPILQGEASLEPHSPWVVLALAALLLLPLGIALGTSVPLAWRIGSVDGRRAASHAGGVLSFNTLGGLLGSLLAGFVVVPALGVELSLRCVAAVHLLTAALAFAFLRGAGPVRRVAGVALSAALGMAIFLAGPGLALPFLLDARNDPYEAVIHGPGKRWSDKLLFLREGRNTTVSVVRAEGALRLFNDGRPESGFGHEEPVFGAELALLGSLPTLFAEDHERAMVIGLGAGHTASAILAGGWKRVDVAELEEAMVEAARVLHREYGRPFPLDDPRARLIVDDARAQLVLADPGTYDAIVSQPSHPWLAGSSALYTREFFQEARRALNERGVIVIWVNLFRIDVSHIRSVAATLLEVFPHGHAFVAEDSSFVLCASTRPIVVGSVFAARAQGDELLPVLSPHQLDHVIDLAAVRELDPEGLVAFARDAAIIEDDRPSLELDLALIPSSRSVQLFELDRAMAAIPWITRATYEELPEPDRVDVLLQRLVEVTDRRIAVERVSDSLDALPLEDSERDQVLGAIAEARGDLSGALGHYDHAGLRSAAYAADRLRNAERMHASLILQARRRTVSPTSARFVLSSAAALASRPAVRTALAVAEAARDRSDERLAGPLRAWLSGCEPMLAEEHLEAAAAGDEHVAFLAEACAQETGDHARALRYAEMRNHRRRVISSEAGELGLEASQHHNRGAAIRYLRRSLAANPAHGGSAAALARLLAPAHRGMAHRVLLEARAAAEGLPKATETIDAAAAELGIVLESPGQDE